MSKGTLLGCLLGLSVGVDEEEDSVVRAKAATVTTSIISMMNVSKYELYELFQHVLSVRLITQEHQSK